MTEILRTSPAIEGGVIALLVVPLSVDLCNEVVVGEKYNTDPSALKDATEVNVIAAAVSHVAPKFSVRLAATNTPTELISSIIILSRVDELAIIV